MAPRARHRRRGNGGAFLGRLVLEKGLDVFSDAIDAARAKGVPLRVVAIGDGPARGYFEERLPDAVFTGQLTGEELATALASTDVFLNPSITETFGNVTLEAMACGLPVVAAAASGATSLVQDGVNGAAVEPGDIDALADALADYQRDPDLRAGMARPAWVRQDDGLGRNQRRRDARL